jgi:hypothetical protein
MLMTNIEIARQRMLNQHIATQSFNKPADIVQYMGAVQAQDYAGAKWAVGMRLQKSSDAAIDKAMASGSIIRTHVLRPTWHFVTPADARWMIELTAPRINISAAGRHRQLKLDSKTLKLSNDTLAGALIGKKQLMRLELQDALHKAGINTDEQRFVHILMQAELDQVICSGGRQGKQFTYALFDDRVPKGNDYTHDEAVAELVKRYFISRGPATLRDFTWWSGLTVADAKNGLEAVKDELAGVNINGLTYWMSKYQPELNNKAPLAHLLPAYDEFAVAYSGRTAIVNPKYLTEAKYVIFAPSIVVNNQVVGTWKRIIKKNGAEVILEPFGKPNKMHTTAIEAAVKRYQRFIKG